MPTILQGDVFNTSEARGRILILAFGGWGGNHLLCWHKFTQSTSSLKGITDPFLIASAPFQYAPNSWVWCVKDRRGQGLSDDELRQVFADAYQWAREHGINTILTNGVKQSGQLDMTKKLRNDHRARMSIALAENYEREGSLHFVLVNLRNVFIRNSGEGREPLEI